MTAESLVVVAREYGLPVVVGVEHATQLIRDGRGFARTEPGGHVELLPAEGRDRPRRVPHRG